MLTCNSNWFYVHLPVIIVFIFVCVCVLHSHSMLLIGSYSTYSAIVVVLMHSVFESASPTSYVRCRNRYMLIYVHIAVLNRYFSFAVLFNANIFSYFILCACFYSFVWRHQTRFFPFSMKCLLC